MTPAEKNRAKVKRWRLENPEKHRAKERERREKHREARRASFAAWRDKNRERVRKNNRNYAARHRSKLALKELAEVKAAAKPSTPSPKISALLKLAEVKATQAQYGITRIGYQEHR